jgi:signal transduction histidine kinase
MKPKTPSRLPNLTEGLLRHGSGVLLVLDEHDRVLEVNAITLHQLGFRRVELLGRRLDETGVLSAREQRQLRARQPRATTLHGKQGRPWPVALTCARLTLGKKQWRFITGVDRRAEEALEQHLLTITDQLQADLGHDLHDGIGQTLTGVVSLLEMLAAELSGPTQQQALRLHQLLQESVLEVRRMSHGLSPAVVETRGLGGALELLAETLRRNHRTACQLNLDKDLLIQDLGLQTHLYRLAQEAAHNALRHGHAKHVQVVLQRRPDGLAELRIEDDGRGFTQRKKPQPGIGLKVMEYRAQKIGGHLDIRPRRPHGVVVSCCFPIA